VYNICGAIFWITAGCIFKLVLPQVLMYLMPFHAGNPQRDLQAVLYHHDFILSILKMAVFIDVLEDSVCRMNLGFHKYISKIYKFVHTNGHINKVCD